MGSSFAVDRRTRLQERRERQELQQSKKIDRQLRMMDTEEKRKVVQLLVLGITQSGKSTLMKFFTLLSKGEEYSKKQALGNKRVIHATIVQDMRFLLEHGFAEGIDWGELEPIAKAFTKFSDFVALKPNSEVVGMLKELWESAVVTNLWKEYQGNLPIANAFEVFMDELKRITAPEYSPSIRDMLLVRKETRGVITDEIKIDGVIFRMISVADQTLKSNILMHRLNDVSAIIFMAAASDYDLTSTEDPTTNRLQESLMLFDKIINHNAFFNVRGVILLLNKADILMEKISQRIPLNISGLFPDAPEFVGDINQDLEIAKEYIKSLFWRMMHRANTDNTHREIYMHFSTATDPKTMRIVFEATRDTVLKRNLEGYAI